MDDKFCPKCGRAHEPGDDFCPGCGTDFRKTVSQVAPPVKPLVRSTTTARKPDASLPLVGVMLVLVVLYFVLKDATILNTGQNLIESLLHPAPACNVATSVLQAKHGTILSFMNGQVQHGILMCGASDGHGSREVDFNWDYQGQSHSAHWLISTSGIILPSNDTAAKIEQAEKLGSTFFHSVLP